MVSRRQLLAAGLSAEQGKHRPRTARLHELHRGIYLVGHEVPPPYAREQAALLAYHPDAILSHRSAANLWNLRPYPATAPVCLTVAPGRATTRPRIVAHRARLARRDIRHRHALPLTSPPRTILDLAAHLPAADLEHLVAEAHYRKLASEAELHDQLGRNPGKRGNPGLRRILGIPGGPQRTRSTAERSLLRLLREAGVTGYKFNQQVHGYEVDFLWPELDLAVELDGYDGHSSRAAFERDRLKIAKLKASGLDVLPVTPRGVRDDPTGVIDRLLRALDRAGAR